MYINGNCKTSKILELQFCAVRKCHSLFGIKDLVRLEKPETFTISPVHSGNHGIAIEMIKKYYLSEHVLVRARNMDLSDDRAIDEYLTDILKQGHSLFAKTEDGTAAGICVNCVSSQVDAKNLRSYAFYRQDPNTKDFLYFTAKLQETPNLWNIFKQREVFEMKMLAVLPEFRRQGVATMLAEKSKIRAQKQGYQVIRMDCMNPYDYKIAERCMLSCLLRFPLHKLRGAHAPFIKRSSEHNKYVRVYVAHAQQDLPAIIVKRHEIDENMIE
ncbi:uncharacterized protein LOC124536474 [Vanessa cardui]|uniref:uncharacterized protein LOC124536474 n=1 Tax=Vanessa cardui TaxID=171605 RepID=UPI001F14785B|nr:uncharacterized protein LOC124536474 [Vanessa cardui]